MLSLLVSNAVPPAALFEAALLGQLREQPPNYDAAKADCHQWAVQGECLANPEWMRQHCKQACSCKSRAAIGECDRQEATALECAKLLIIARAPVHAAVRRATEAPEANATAVGAARRLVDALAAREDDAYDARYRDLRYLADVCGPLAAEAVDALPARLSLIHI